MIRLKNLLTLTLLLIAAPALTRAQSDPLTAGFLNPPNTAKPHTWWHWMNGNVSKPGITLDLQAMKRVGIGGAHLAQVGTGIPQGPLAYDSPELVDCIRFALSEADRLGLDLCMFNCPGWSSSGGPWITPDNSMKVLAYTETPVTGGNKVTVALPQPTSKLDFYRDAYILAYPTPAADARIPNFNNGMRAVPRSPTSPATASAPAPVAAANPTEPAIDPASVLDLTKNMDAKGNLTWDAPPGNWTILRVGFTTNGTNNHPGPEGGVGLEVDKFSRDALTIHFNAFFGKYYDAMKPLAAKHQIAALIDSYETGLQNWTDKFPEEFKKRRGYDLMRFMPAMALGRVVGNLDISQRFLWDVRKTQGELMNENYYGAFTELCHQHGMLAYTEPYDNGNFDEMIAGSYADMPMAEFWQGQANQRSVKLVASVMHMNGQPVMGAESFTSQSRWTEYPYSLKALGDFMWTQGLNKFVFHRFAHQPNPNPNVFPAMTMGPWGGHFDRTNTWFEQGSAWLKYVARSQFLLQQGVFAGDLVYFAGEDSPVRNPDESKLVPAPPTGYGYDTIDTVTMKTRVKIVDGKITLPDGLTYRLFVLPPNISTMSVETLQNLHDLVNQGMTLVVSAPAPQRTPSLMNYPAGDETVQKLAADLWANLNGTTVTEHSFGKGRVFWGLPLAEVLKQKLNIKPDFESSARSGNADINYIHKHVGDTEVYFVANRSHRPEDLVCTFNVTGKLPEFWDADSAQITPALLYDFVDGRTCVAIQLPPSGSIFVVFRSAAPANHFTSLSKDGTALAAFVPFPTNGPAAPIVNTPRSPAFPVPLPPTPAYEPVEYTTTAPLAWENGTYVFYNARSQPTQVSITNVPAPLDLTTPWRVAFPPNLGAPPVATFDKLISWTDSADSGIQHFSGTATYTNKFTLPPDATSNNRRLFLDLGRVQVLAEVIVNGKNLGILWKLPFRTDITDAAHPGENTLEIRVTNLWPNRLIGDEQQPPENEYASPGRGGRGGANIVKLPDWYTHNLPKPDSPRVTFTTWHHWSADDKLLESGLIGPVQIRTAAPLKFQP